MSLKCSWLFLPRGTVQRLMVFLESTARMEGRERDRMRAVVFNNVEAAARERKAVMMGAAELGFYLQNAEPYSTSLRNRDRERRKQEDKQEEEQKALPPLFNSTPWNPPSYPYSYSSLFSCPLVQPQEGGTKEKKEGGHVTDESQAAGPL